MTIKYRTHTVHFHSTRNTTTGIMHVTKIRVRLVNGLVLFAFWSQQPERIEIEKFPI